jgi:carboxyl-terminal processing protease
MEFLLGRHAPGSGTGTEPVILDLRDATGGDLYEAFDTAAMFLPPGTRLGTMLDRDGNRREFFSPAGEKKTMPLALFIGPDTASAAEIFAGALHRNGRGVLIGRPSYGKCSSQTDTHLSDGSVLRFTNSEVLLPDGDTCSGKGLRPDLEVGDAEQGNLSLLLKKARQAFK